MARRTLSPRASRITGLVLGIVFSALGIVCVFTARSNAEQIAPVANGLTTSGTITSFRVGQSCGRYSCSTYWVGTIQYRTRGGEAVTFTGPQDSNEEFVGQAVTVSYDPADPRVAHDLSADNGSSVLESGLGAGLIAFGVATVVLGHRRVAGGAALHGTSAWPGHRLVHSTRGIVAGILVGAGLFTAAVMVA